MSNEKLKPCPSCGKTTEDMDDTHAVRHIAFKHLGDECCTSYYVDCTFCGMTGPLSNTDGGKGAVDGWNALAGPGRSSELQGLKEIGERLRTQGNRATAHPMFCVQKKVVDVGHPATWESGRCWYNQNSGVVVFDEKPRGNAWTAYGYRERWETVMVAFTEQGCKDYLELDGHNIRHSAHNGEVRIYVESFNRCNEMIQIREALMSNAAEQQGQSGWQPIATAPKDGSILEMCDVDEPHYRHFLLFDRNYWHRVNTATAVVPENFYTHWRFATPLPEPPATEESA